jgi:acetylornithine deacetylase
MNIHQEIVTEKAIDLLKKLISTPSFSGEEGKTGDAIEGFLQGFGVKTHRQYNNIYAFNKHFDERKPTLLLNSHHDTGLVVFDGVVEGTPSHAAHPNNNNCIYNAIETLQWFRDYSFEKVSEALGEVKLTVTQINAGKQHNVVPAQVDLVIDVRVNDCYSNQEIADILQKEAPCKLTPRSLRLNSSCIDPEHDLVKSGLALGRKTYGSPTLSDQAALTCQSVKLGPGDSTRSHSANEYIFVREIEEGIDLYIKILTGFLQ